MIQGRWIVRRLAPDCSRIDLESLPAGQDQGRLLTAVGAETANIHLGSDKARKLLRYLKSLPKSWLKEATSEMVDVVRVDWRHFTSAV
jgi:hypothetical protein